MMKLFFTKTKKKSHRTPHTTRGGVGKNAGHIVGFNWSRVWGTVRKRDWERKTKRTENPMNI